MNTTSTMKAYRANPTGRKAGFDSLGTPRHLRSRTVAKQSGRRHLPQPNNTERSTWKNMLRRCFNTKDMGYHRYGGRGITVDEDWLSFDVFFRDMGKRPRFDMSLHRVNNDGPYAKWNCVWADRKTQSQNKRKPSKQSDGGRFFDLSGVRLALNDWLGYLNTIAPIEFDRLHFLVIKQGMSIKDVVDELRGAMASVLQGHPSSPYVAEYGSQYAQGGGTCATLTQNRHTE